MPRIAKKLTEKLRKKAIRRKSLRQKKRTMKKKNNARRTRRNMRKRNKRGGMHRGAAENNGRGQAAAAAAEEEEEEEEDEEEEEYFGNWENRNGNNESNHESNDENNNGPNGSISQPITDPEIESAMERFTDSFNNKEEQVIAKLMMKENNKVIRIMNPNGTVGKEIEVLKSIKDKLRIDGADLDVQFNLYLCEKLNITIEQLKDNLKGYKGTAAASSNANHAQAVRVAHQEQYIHNLENILEIIKKAGKVSKDLVEELKESLGYNNMQLNQPDEIFAWAQFVAGFAMIASNTNYGSIMGVLTILFSNRKGKILEKIGPHKKPLRLIVLELLESKQTQLVASADLHMKRIYKKFSNLLSDDTQIRNMNKMLKKMITVVRKFFEYIITLEPHEKVDHLPHFSLVQHHINRPKKHDRGYHSNPELTMPPGKRGRVTISNRNPSL